MSSTLGGRGEIIDKSALGGGGGIGGTGRSGIGGTGRGGLRVTNTERSGVLSLGDFSIGFGEASSTEGTMSLLRSTLSDATLLDLVNAVAVDASLFAIAGRYFFGGVVGGGGMEDLLIGTDESLLIESSFPLG
jgi:hypothetical protein